MKILYLLTIEELITISRMVLLKEDTAELLGKISDLEDIGEDKVAEFSSEANEQKVVESLIDKRLIMFANGEYRVDRVISGLVRAMAVADEVIPYDLDILFVKDEFLILLLKDSMSKDKYKLIPFRDKKEMEEQGYGRVIS